MKVLVLVGLVALVGYAAADCGCLRCAKHLTVVGKTLPTGNCPSTTVICRGPPSAVQGGQAMSVKVQTPVPMPSISYEANDDRLRYRIVSSAPCGAPIRTIEPSGFAYDAKIDVPIPSVSTKATTTSVNMKPCVDRIVLPSPPQGCGAGTGEQVTCGKTSKIHFDTLNEPTVYVNPLRDGQTWTTTIRDVAAPTWKTTTVREAAAPAWAATAAAPAWTATAAAPAWTATTAVPSWAAATIREVAAPACAVNAASAWASPVQSFGAWGSAFPVLKAEEIRTTSGPAIDYSTVTKTCVPRYTNTVKTLSKRSGLKVRSKREIPFLRHGYKFVMNMLPEFVQQPIKDTVNDLALTHPDNRLRMVYNRPRKLSLKEKLQMQRKKNLVSLRKKLRDRVARNNLVLEPYPDRDVGKYRSSSYDPVRYGRPYQFTSRSKFEDQNVRSFDSEDLGSRYSTRSFKDKDAVKLDNSPVKRNHKLLEILQELSKPNADFRRNKRAAVYERNWPYRYKKPSPIKKKHSTLFDSSELVLPFYHIKEESSDEMEDNDVGYTPWDAYLRSSPPRQYRYRRQDDAYNFIEPYRLKSVAPKIYRDEIRNVVRQELAQNRFKIEENAIENKASSPLSPLLHIVTFPLRLLSQFKDVFPEVESVPKLVKDTKKYFRDFGKNLKKNALHLTSDLIGDFENLDLNNNIVLPPRQRRNADVMQRTSLGKILPKALIENHYEPDYSLVFGNGDHEVKGRSKRYILKMVDEDEVSDYLFAKLAGIFDPPESSVEDVETHPIYQSYPSYPYEDYWDRRSIEEKPQKKPVLQQLKPKLILDNNGRPFLEINGYKRPLTKKKQLNKRRKLKTNPLVKLRYDDSSEEVDAEKISSLIDQAKDHVEASYDMKYSEMPIKTIKIKISQLLLETDMLVHMNFEKYDVIYDNLVALQHLKTSIVQDWKRLILTKAINDIDAKVQLLEKFRELQFYKDLTLTTIVDSLYEDNENIFMVKKLIKMLVRLQKLQCLINQVVENFHNHLHISSRSEIAKEIKYVDFLSSINFSNEKSRNKLIANLVKDRDAALQSNISLLDKLKNLIQYEQDNETIEKEASLLWEMKNIENMQKTTIEEMKPMLDHGYKIKKELKILFDLIKRYESCEENQRKLLSKFEEDSNEEKEQEGSSEEVGVNKIKKAAAKRKLDMEELRVKWQEKVKKRQVMLKKKLEERRNNRKRSEESVEEE